jgi:hypothetical protein
VAFGTTFTPLDDVEVVTPVAAGVLARVGITSVEELLSAIIADRRSLRDLLRVSDRELDEVERRCRWLADPKLVEAIGAPAPEGAAGALPPSRSRRRGPYPRRMHPVERR